MDKSFTSLTSMKGPSRQECSEFIVKFKSAILRNTETERSRMNGDNITSEQERREYEQNQINDTGAPVRDVGTSLRGEQEHNHVGFDFNAYRIKIGKEYVITISATKDIKRAIRSVNSKKEKSEHSEQAEMDNPNVDNNEHMNRRPAEEQTESNETVINTIPLSKSNDIQDQSNHAQPKGVERLDDTADKTESSKPNNAETTESTAKTSVDNVENKSNDVRTESVEKQGSMDKLNSETIKTISSSENIPAIEDRGRTMNDDSKQIKVSERDEENETAAAQSQIEEHNPIQREPAEQASFQKESLATASQHEERTAQTIQQEEPTEQASLQKGSIALNIQGGTTARVTFQMEPTPQESDRTLSSLKNTSFESSMLNMTQMSEELDEWLRGDKASGISSDCLCRLLNVLEDMSANMFPNDEDSQESSSSSSAVLPNNFCIVNIEQIKSMGEIMERINKVIAALMEYCDTEHESTKSLNRCKSTDTSTYRTNEGASSNTETSSGTRNTEGMIGTNESASSIRERNTTGREASEWIGNRVTDQSTRTSEDFSSQPVSFRTSSVPVNDFPSECLQSSCFSKSIPSSATSDDTVECRPPACLPKSLGSQTSDTDVRIQALIERGMQSNRQKVRFRSSTKRNPSNNSANTADELLALLDDVEKLLINNCADRYEMMILLEQIFSDYSMSAHKAVADLKKFIVTFNKNNSYL